MSYQTPNTRTDSDPFGFESYGLLHDAIIASAFDRTPIGGSRRFHIEGTGYQDAYDAVPFTIPDSASAGATWKVDVWSRTANAATSITPRVRNITDSTDADVGSPITATSFTKQTLTFTPVVGKEYRLQFVKSDDVYPCWGFGILQRTDS